MLFSGRCVDSRSSLYILPYLSVVRAPRPPCDFQYSAPSWLVIRQPYSVLYNARPGVRTNYGKIYRLDLKSRRYAVLDSPICFSSEFAFVLFKLQFGAKFNVLFFGGGQLKMKFGQPDFKDPCQKGNYIFKNFASPELA